MSYSEEDYRAMAAACGLDAECRTEMLNPEKVYHVELIEELSENHVKSRPWQPDTDPADCFQAAIDAGLFLNREFIGHLQIKLYEAGKMGANKQDAAMKAVCKHLIKIGSQNGRSDALNS